jgi:hypothetical protein
VVAGEVLTTVSRFLDEEHRQIAIPVAQRSAPAFGDLADSISGDLGGGEELQPCSPQRWSAGSAGTLQPRLGRAGIPRSPG